MSVSMPILMTLSEIWASAMPAPAPSAAATARPSRVRLKIFMLSPRYDSKRASRHANSKNRQLARASHAQVVVQLRHVGIELRVGDHVDHAPIFHHIVPVGDGGREMEILFDQQNRESPRFELGDGTSDLLNDDRRETLGRL